MWKKEYNVIKVTNYKPKKTNEFTVIESEVKLVLNNEYLHIFNCTQTLSKELIIGHLFSEGIINCIEDIASIDQDSLEFKVILKKDHKTSQSLLKRPSKNFSLKASDVVSISQLFYEKAILYKDTSISQSFCFGYKNEIRYFSEDFNYENALKKTIGQLMINKESESPNFIMTTDKVDYNTIKSLSLFNINFLITRLSATDKAIDYAHENNICLICFSRSNRFHVFTKKDFVKF